MIWEGLCIVWNMSETMGSEPSCESPLAENPFPPDSVEGRLYEAISNMESPRTAAELATRSACEPQTAREYLQSFLSLGVVIAHDGDPPTYERNDAYFEWDTVTTLAETRSLAALEDEIETLLEEIQTYQERYDSAVPDDVTEPFSESTQRDVTAWIAARTELRRVERARQIRLVDADDAE